MAPPLSAIGGLLVRQADGWRWRDGSPEPRVRDLTAAQAFEFPRVRSIDPATGAVTPYVSITREALDEDADLLGDVIAFAGSRALHVGGPRGTVEVPEEIWDAWASDRVIGLGWNPSDEADILARAESLGAHFG
jgi:hypothetical protein